MPQTRADIYRAPPPSSGGRERRLAEEEAVKRRVEAVAIHRRPTRPTPDHTAKMRENRQGIMMVKKPETRPAQKPGAVRVARASARGMRAGARGTSVRGGAVAKRRGFQIPWGAIGKPRERLSKFDYPFFMLVVVLLAFGIVMMFSASYAYAFKETGDSFYYAGKQLQFIGVGLCVMIVLSFVDYHIMLNKFIVRIGIIGSVGLMLMVKFGIGVTQGGAERWLGFGSFVFQPSEILKFAVIMVFAYLAHTRYEKIKELKAGFMPFCVCLLIACGLTIIQPHLSGTIIIFCIGITMMFVGDCRFKHLIVMLLIFAVLGVVALMGLRAIGYDYFGSRLLSWQNPEADIHGETYQTYQSLITIGSGGMFGLGLGNSRQKYYYLPASHNDFVFSIICEELGFIGAGLVILLFILFVFRGFYISSRARDKFGMMLGVGITMQIGVQALMNIAVVSNSMPNTGISLPFFSYGGSALLMQMAEIGVLLNISRKAAIE